MRANSSSGPNGLRHVIIGAGIKGRDFASLLASDREDDDGYRPARTQLLTDQRPVHVRQAKIDNHQIRPLGVEQLESFGTAARGDDRVTSRPQQGRNWLAESRVRRQSAECGPRSCHVEGRAIHRPRRHRNVQREDRAAVDVVRGRDATTLNGQQAPRNRETHPGAESVVCRFRTAIERARRPALSRPAAAQGRGREP